MEEMAHTTWSDQAAVEDELRRGCDVEVFRARNLGCTTYVAVYNGPTEIGRPATVRHAVYDTSLNIIVLDHAYGRTSFIRRAWAVARKAAAGC